MNTIARKLPIFVLMAAALTTALTIGATTTLAVSNTYTRQLQLMGNDDSLASTNNEFGDFNSAQYAWSHPYHHSSTDMIADFNGDNSSSTTSSDYHGGFNSAQYGGVQPHHHHSSTDMISNFNNDNSTGNVGSDGFADLNSAQYGSSDSHSRHHQNSTPNSSWMWPTQHSAPDIVDLN
jgi:hypothetical protein